jgi:hypothetical protein
MSKLSVDQALIAAGEGKGLNKQFVDTVMNKVGAQSHVINSSVLRNMSEQHNKGELFMRKLRALPIGTAILLAVASVVLVGGVSYAAYKLLWEPLIITQSSVSTDGNKKRVAFDLSGCSGLDGTAETRAMIESRINDGVSPAEAEKYVGAYCEINRIHQYGYELVGAETDQAKATSGIWLDYEPVLYSEVPNGELGNVHRLTDATQYIVAGEQRTANDFADSDLVFRIMKYETDGEDAYTDATVLAIAKASYESKFYDTHTASQNGIVHAIPCRNNTEEFCTNGPSGYPIYRALPDTAGPEYQPSPSEQRMIDAIGNNSTAQFEGSIVGISGDTVTIKTSSGRLMNIELPLGTVDKAIASYQDLGTKFGVGSRLMLSTVSADRDNLKSIDLLNVSML